MYQIELVVNFEAPTDEAAEARSILIQRQIKEAGIATDVFQKALQHWDLAHSEAWMNKHT